MKYYNPIVKLLKCKEIIIMLCLLSEAYLDLNAVPSSDTLVKYRVKLDLIAFRSVFFDVRKQIRIGIEYQKLCGKRHFICHHLDLGLYDDYSFFKYYDFFNQNGGMYYTRQDVKTSGFHSLTSWNYHLSKPYPHKRSLFFAGLTGDLNVFEKKIKFYNSQTFDKSSKIQKQVRLGLGIHLGMTRRLTKRFHIELKGIMIAGLLTWRSEKDMKPIKPFKSVWFDDRQHFWFIPQFNICYDF